jgi:hypothetical protein
MYRRAANPQLGVQRESLKTFQNLLRLARNRIGAKLAGVLMGWIDVRLHRHRQHSYRNPG